jgi:hypothetical protein
MYASNLQELLFHCSEGSDLSPHVFAEFTERFNALRNYGHLPKGREQRKYLLTPTQVALAILGLVPTRPSWAGHAATVLKTFSPVGGPKAGFHNTTSLIEALVRLLTDAGAREGLIAARIVLGSTGVNSTGGASFTYEHGGVRRNAFFMPYDPTSLTQDGAESAFDFEGRLLSMASREMRFGKSFFQRVARAMEIAAIRPGEPAGDGSEYEEEEAKQARWKKLGVTRHSSFLNMRTDNYVTWPSEPSLVKFDGYHFVLMPGTTDNVQSIHIDLRANKLDAGKATTVIRRFLSVMAWCDDNFATLGFGWSGSPVPVPITKH